MYVVCGLFLVRHNRPTACSTTVCAQAALSFAMPGLFLSPNQKLLDSALHSHEATSFFERQPRSYSIIRESMAL